MLMVSICLFSFELLIQGDESYKMCISYDFLYLFLLTSYVLNFIYISYQVMVLLVSRLIWRQLKKHVWQHALRGMHLKSYSSQTVLSKVL